MSIFPYAYRMIESFEITNDSTQISIYAGMLITSFAFAEFSTGMIWGRISDKIGRKPVLIMGLIGTALSMIAFGFAKSLTSAVVARALGGLLNGNVGVLQTTVAELVTVKEHQPRAYSIMPFVWCLGSIIGPAMGGALAMPCEAYPWLFPRDSLFERYPFLLPNLVCVLVLMSGITVGVLFLEETHAQRKNVRDCGLDCGHLISTKVFGDCQEVCEDRKAIVPAAEEQILDDQPPGYRSTEGSPRITVVSRFNALPASITDVEVAAQRDVDLGASKTFNKQVIMIIIGYGILA